jgi:hypothetical protein
VTTVRLDAHYLKSKAGCRELAFCQANGKKRRPTFGGVEFMAMFMIFLPDKTYRGKIL